MRRFCDGTDPNLVKEDGKTPCDCGATFDDVNWMVIYPHQEVHGTLTLKPRQRYEVPYTGPSTSFEHLRTANIWRTESAFHPIDSWSESDWMVAAVGEIGEAANKIKKRNRMKHPSTQFGSKQGDITIDDVMDEMADCVIYLDLLATKMNRRLEDAIVRVFNKKSEEIESKIVL